jgi:hypothetical protein
MTVEFTIYYSVLIPWVPVKYQTQWHPTEATGPFSTLCRGVFSTPEEAIEWAKKHLNGTPYSVHQYQGIAEN